jgi:hypothetical protein
MQSFSKWPHFLTTKDELVIQNYAKLVKWAEQEPQYVRKAKDDFMQSNNADAWVIGYALTNKLTVVTQEVPNANIQRKIPIPNVCDFFHINYCNTFEMLKKLGFKF